MNAKSSITVIRRVVKGLVLLVAIYLFVTSIPAFIGWEDLFGTAGARTIEDAVSRVIFGVGLVAALLIGEQIIE